MFHQGDSKTTISIPDELGKLAKLKEQGVITKEEFADKKEFNGRNESVIAQKEIVVELRHRQLNPRLLWNEYFLSYQR